MTVQLTLQRGQHWFLSGSTSEPRLLHSDSSDCILVCPPHLGEGYTQKIPLREDLELVILDYKLAHTVMFESPHQEAFLEFEFQLAGPDAGQSFWRSYPGGLKELVIKPAGIRLFKVEVFFKRPTLLAYCQLLFDCLPPETQSVVGATLDLLARHLSGSSAATEAGTLRRIFDRESVPFSNVTFNQLLTDDFYAQASAFSHIDRIPIAPAMETAIANILSCPYQGATRRRYLERQALKLVALHLDALAQPKLPAADLHCIYQAAAILRAHVTAPPSVENLARQVGTNRLKLNQGFHRVYGTTPFGYLRHCRLHQAQRLLETSELSVSQVAAAVGYTSRSRFATAFCQRVGVNPKTFQRQAWQYAS